MIHELLNPKRLRSAIRRLSEEAGEELRLLRQEDRLARELAEETGNSEEDMEEVKGKLDDYEAEEAGDLAGGGEPIWIPRDPVGSLVLSAYEEYFERLGGSAGVGRRPGSRRRTGAGFAGTVG